MASVLAREGNQESSRQHRKLRFAGAALVVAGLVATGVAASANFGRDGGDQGEDQQPYAIGLWGDLPYSDAQAITGVPNLIADMNSQELAFTAHDGDLKAGNGTP